MLPAHGNNTAQTSTSQAKPNNTQERVKFNPPGLLGRQQSPKKEHYNSFSAFQAELNNPLSAFQAGLKKQPRDTWSTCGNPHTPRPTSIHSRPFAQVLSSECQKRRFNPEFLPAPAGFELFTCDVKLRDVIIKGRRAYSSVVQAKQEVAKIALRIIRDWPIDGEPVHYGFLGLVECGAHISVEVDVIHDKLRELVGRQNYTLWTKGEDVRVTVTRGSPLLLQFTAMPKRDLRIHAPAFDLLFKAISKNKTCEFCLPGADEPPHTLQKCSNWIESQAPWTRGREARSDPRLAGTRTGSNSIAISRGPEHPRTRPHHNGYTKPEPRDETATELYRVPPVKQENKIPAEKKPDQQAHLIRNIQDVMGEWVPTDEIQDPKVKAAFLEGIALGTRLATAAPGQAFRERERKRSRSPARPAPSHAGNASVTHSNHSTYPRYRVRSPPRAAAPAAARNVLVYEPHRRVQYQPYGGEYPRQPNGHDNAHRGGHSGSHWNPSHDNRFH